MGHGPLASQNPPEYRRRVFICYAHVQPDRDVANQLACSLSDAYDVFVDSHLDGGDRWSDRIETELENSDAIVVLISPDALKSEMVLAELETAHTRERVTGHPRIIPVWVGFFGRYPLRARAYLSRFQHVACSPTDSTDTLVKKVHDALDRMALESRSSTQKPLVWRTPYTPKHYFTNRDEILQSLHGEYISRRDSCAVQVLTGMPGIGKTEIAIEYAYRYCGTYELISWLNANEPGLNTLIDRIRDTIRRERYEHWLIIIDDVSNYAAIESSIPRDGHGQVIMTSRSGLWARTSVYPVYTLSRPDAVHLLLAMTGQDDECGATRLAEEVEDFPMALEQFGAFTMATVLSLQSCADMICERLESSESVGGDLDSRSGHTLSVAWTAALDRIVNYPEALELLHYCAFLAPNNIPRVLLQTLVGDANRAIIVLRGHSLVRVSPDVIHLHGLFHQWLQLKIVDSKKRQLLSKIVESLKRVLQVQESSVGFLLLPHALAALIHTESIGLENTSVGALWAICDEYLRKYSEHERAKDALTKADEILGRIIKQSVSLPYFERQALLLRLADVKRKLGDSIGAGQAILDALRIANQGVARYDNGGYGSLDDDVNRFLEGQMTPVILAVRVEYTDALRLTIGVQYLGDGIPVVTLSGRRLQVERVDVNTIRAVLPGTQPTGLIQTLVITSSKGGRAEISVTT